MRKWNEQETKSNKQKTNCKKQLAKSNNQKAITKKQLSKNNNQKAIVIAHRLSIHYTPQRF